jgi:GNAT superfamily N-acetyltransferase
MEKKAGTIENLTIAKQNKHTSTDYLFFDKNTDVGKASYTVLPILNIIIINLLKIAPDYREQGYGKVISSYLLQEIVKNHPNNHYVFWLAQSLDQTKLSNTQLCTLYQRHKGRILVSFSTNLPTIFCKRIKKPILTNVPTHIIDSDGNPQISSKL